MLGPEGCPLAWCLKSVDRHTRGCGLTAAVPACPLRAGWGWCTGEPAETPRPGVPGAGDAGGRAGGWRKSQVGPPTPTRGSLVCHVEAVGRALAGLGGAVAHSQPPAPQPTWGPRNPKKRERVTGGPRDPPLWGRCAESHSSATSEMTSSIWGRGTQRGSVMGLESQSGSRTTS